ncbi:MAG TPA: DUF2752 domain-containing protein [Lysobacter sp.]
MSARVDTSARRMACLGLLGTGALGGAWLLRAFDPDAAGNAWPPCVFHLLTGLHCPGCGLTRALHALARGDIAGAWAMHPLLLAALPLLAAMLWQWATRRVLLPAAMDRRLHDGATWIVALLAFGVLRNLPWPAFAWMAPG